MDHPHCVFECDNETLVVGCAKDRSSYLHLSLYKVVQYIFGLYIYNGRLFMKPAWKSEPPYSYSRTWIIIVQLDHDVTSLQGVWDNSS